MIPLMYFFRGNSYVVIFHNWLITAQCIVVVPGRLAQAVEHDANHVKVMSSSLIQSTVLFCYAPL